MVHIYCWFDYKFFKQNIYDPLWQGWHLKLSVLDKKNLEGAGYKDSRLWLNKYLSNIDKWDKTEIEKRFTLIAERFLEIWKYPTIKFIDKIDNDEMNIFEAEEPKYKKLEYAIFFNRQIEVTQISKYVEVFKKLFEIQLETFFTTDIGKKLDLQKI